MVNLSKWIKGVFYSCQHQEKGSSSCDECRRQREGTGQPPLSFNGSLNCKICLAQLGNLKQECNSPIENEHKILVDECYQDKKDRQDEKDSRFACSKCHTKYEKLALCPYCLKNKEDFDNLCCSQCRPGKASQEIQQKYEEYKNSVMGGQNPTQGGDNDLNSYLPYILGGVGIVGVIIGIFWLVNRNKKEKY